MSRARRVVVVGAGVTGLLAAVACVRAGHRVTVLDRGAIPDPASGSYDQHRALRLVQPDDPAATRARAAAATRWLELETVLSERFYRRVGVITAWSGDRVPAVFAAAAEAGLPVSVAPPEKLGHLGIRDGAVAVLESEAGVLLADRVLRAATRWLAARPAAELRPHSPVTRADLRRGPGGFDADAVLVAAGAWSGALTGLPVQLYRQTSVYLRPPDELAEVWRDAPAAGGLGPDGRAWLLPPGDGALLKISSDAVCRPVDGVAHRDPDTRWVGDLLTGGVVSEVERYRLVAVRRCHYAGGRADGLDRPLPGVWSRTAPGGAGFGSTPLVTDRFMDEMEEAA